MQNCATPDNDIIDFLFSCNNQQRMQWKFDFLVINPWSTAYPLFSDNVIKSFYAIFLDALASLKPVLFTDWLTD